MTDPTPPRRTLPLATLLLALAQPVAGAIPFLGLGHSIGDMAAASTTAASPATYAFVIWTPIFLLSIIWAVRQMWLEDATTERLRRPLALAFALNVLWMLLAEFTANGLHLVAVLAGGVAAALWAFLPEARRLPEGAFARWLLRPFLGLFAGWVTAAVFANLAGALKATGLDPDPWLSALIVLLAGGMAAVVLRRAQGDPWYVLAAGWALVAVALADFGLAGVGVTGADGHAVQEFRVEIAGGIAALVALGGVVFSAFSIWRRGGMTA
ncbi:hypothetical protein C8P66_14415 [Humitalea rosea]|uniref:TspO/MBR related protein n=1 Tax=Humitalea rosea TaxID=990373 RepID=A0A2W7HU60_9PROT|nr:hypothetical protein [Humitalea rosea]PZW37652.1 hypothetical protein C8P66_14415 [Humitalea rosea]